MEQKCQAHNLKVVGSNPTPATKSQNITVSYNPPSPLACEGFLYLAPIFCYRSSGFLCFCAFMIHYFAY